MHEWRKPVICFLLWTESVVPEYKPRSIVNGSGIVAAWAMSRAPAALAAWRCAHDLFDIKNVTYPSAMAKIAVAIAFIEELLVALRAGSGVE